MDEGNLEEKHSKTEKEVSLEVINKEKEVNLHKDYGIRSRLSQKRQKK